MITRTGIYAMSCAAVALCLSFPLAREAHPGPRFLRAGSMGGDGGGPYVNLIVREVRVSPIRARVGDVVRVELVVEDRGDSYYDNVPAEVRANGKVVASKLVTYGFGGAPWKVHRVTIPWNTQGMPPGEYRIRGEVFLWYDASEFDNFLEVPEPLVLLPADAELGEGKEAGGTAVGVDPRWRGTVPEGKGKPAATTGGY